MALSAQISTNAFGARYRLPDNMTNYGYSLSKLFDLQSPERGQLLNNLSQHRSTIMMNSHLLPDLMPAMISRNNIRTQPEIERAHESTSWQFVNDSFFAASVIAQDDFLVTEVAVQTITDVQTVHVSVLSVDFVPAQAATLSSYGHTVSRSQREYMLTGSRAVGTSESFEELLMDEKYGPAERNFLLIVPLLQLERDRQLRVLDACIQASMYSIAQRTGQLKNTTPDLADAWLTSAEFNRDFGIITRKGMSGFRQAMIKLEQTIRSHYKSAGAPIYIMLSHRAFNVLSGSNEFKYYDGVRNLAEIQYEKEIRDILGFTVQRDPSMVDLAYVDKDTVLGRVLVDGTSSTRVFKLAPSPVAPVGAQNAHTALDMFHAVGRFMRFQNVRDNTLNTDALGNGCSLMVTDVSRTDFHQVNLAANYGASGWWKSDSGNGDVIGSGPGIAVNISVTDIADEVVQEVLLKRSEFENTILRYQEVSNSVDAPLKIRPEDDIALSRVPATVTAIVSNFDGSGGTRPQVAHATIVGEMLPPYMPFKYVQSVALTIRAAVDGALRASGRSGLRKACDDIFQCMRELEMRPKTSVAGDYTTTATAFHKQLFLGLSQVRNPIDGALEYGVEPDTHGYKIPKFEPRFGEGYLAGCHTGPMLLEIAKRPNEGNAGAPRWVQNLELRLATAVNTFKTVVESYISGPFEHSLLLRDEALSAWYKQQKLDIGTIAFLQLVSQFGTDGATTYGPADDAAAGVPLTSDAVLSCFFESGQNMAEVGKADYSDNLVERTPKWRAYDAVAVGTLVANAKYAAHATRGLRIIFCKLMDLLSAAPGSTATAGDANVAVALLFDVLDQLAPASKDKPSREELSTIIASTRLPAAALFGMRSKEARTVLGYSSEWDPTRVTSIAPYTHGGSLLNVDVNTTNMSGVVNDRSLAFAADESYTSGNDRPAVQMAQAAYVKGQRVTAVSSTDKTDGTRGNANGRLAFGTLTQRATTDAGKFWLAHRQDEFFTHYKTFDGNWDMLWLMHLYWYVPMTLAALQKLANTPLVTSPRIHVHQPIDAGIMQMRVFYETSALLAAARGSILLLESLPKGKLSYHQDTTAVIYRMFMRLAAVALEPASCAILPNAWARYISGGEVHLADLSAIKEKGRDFQYEDLGSNQSILALEAVTRPWDRSVATDAELYRRVIEQRPSIHLSKSNGSCFWSWYTVFQLAAQAWHRGVQDASSMITKAIVLGGTPGSGKGGDGSNESLSTLGSQWEFSTRMFQAETRYLDTNGHIHRVPADPAGIWHDPFWTGDHTAHQYGHSLPAPVQPVLIT